MLWRMDYDAWGNLAVSCDRIAAERKRQNEETEAALARARK